MNTWLSSKQIEARQAALADLGGKTTIFPDGVIVVVFNGERFEFSTVDKRGEDCFWKSTVHMLLKFFGKKKIKYREHHNISQGRLFA